MVFTTQFEQTLGAIVAKAMGTKFTLNLVSFRGLQLGIADCLVAVEDGFTDQTGVGDCLFGQMGGQILLLALGDGLCEGVGHGQKVELKERVDSYEFCNDDLVFLEGFLVRF